MRFSKIALPLFALSGISLVYAGPIAYGLCQTGCNTVAVACYAGAGLTFGTVVAAAAAPAAAIACNVALGTCSATCATVALLAPTP
ncbi:Proteophosphoglycan 5 [Mycena sanguinolenta]|uniref:Proteophosphoglycan 5 n=1 Tax=Mycena sanguinolenta TaxID=230812 RepID=A0A8H6Z5N2_9AGAR|nr:Proteophosphoglycan 5 [Mycena sanguinolenta]